MDGSNIEQISLIGSLFDANPAYININIGTLYSYKIKNKKIDTLTLSNGLYCSWKSYQKTSWSGRNAKYESKLLALFRLIYI